VPDEPTEKPDESQPEGEEATAAQDAMSPEAIAKRVAALGGDDEVEKLAREEELKLAERRAKAGGGKGKKSGLEAAASKRLQKIGGKVPPKRIAYAADAAVLGGAGPFGRWFRANQKAVTVVGSVALLAVAGGGAYAWQVTRAEAAASNDITRAVDDEEGRIGDPAKDEDDTLARDPRPVFKTEAERREAALAKYKDVEAKYKGTGAAYLARLEEGSLLLDKPDLDGAIAAFTEAGNSPLAAADAEVKGRALEGLGFAYEAKAAATPAEKDKWLDEAAQEFRALENTDVKGFKELGMYHQARVIEAKGGEGDKEKAIQILKSLHERLTPSGQEARDAHPFVYLETVADDRLRQLDPSALPAKSKAGPGAGGGGAGKMSEEQIQQLLEQLKHQGGGGAGGGAPPAPK
jgi:hypothetical protein